MVDLADGANAADWFNAVGAWLSAGGTVAAVIVALKIARRDGKRLQAEQADRDAAQARLVTVDILGTGYAVGIFNHSMLPILDVRLDRVVVDQHPDWAWLIDSNSNVALVTSLIGPGEHLVYNILFRDSAGNDAFYGPGSRISVEISFFDAKGLAWERENNEQPERVIYPQRTRQLDDLVHRRTWLRWLSNVRSIVAVRWWWLMRKLGFAPASMVEPEPESSSSESSHPGDDSAT